MSWLNHYPITSRCHISCCDSEDRCEPCSLCHSLDRWRWKAFADARLLLLFFWPAFQRLLPSIYFPLREADALGLASKHPCQLQLSPKMLRQCPELSYPSCRHPYIWAKGALLLSQRFPKVSKGLLLVFWLVLKSKLVLISYNNILMNMKNFD